MPIGALKVAVVVMGVLLVAGTATLGVLIARRVAPLAGGGRGAAAPFDTVLNEPADTRIAGIAAVQDRLALHLQGGGADRIVLVDPRTGARSGAIALAR